MTLPKRLEGMKKGSRVVYFSSTGSRSFFNALVTGFGKDGRVHITLEEQIFRDGTTEPCEHRDTHSVPVSDIERVLS